MRKAGMVVLGVFVLLVFTAQGLTPADADLSGALNLWAGVPARQFSTDYSAVARDVHATPEPATFFLIGCGLLLIGIFGARRRRKS
jgi:hypothetical protein